MPHGAHMAIKEVAIHISNHTARVGDRGIVVIGGSVDLGDLAHQGDEGESDLIDTRPCLGMSQRT